MDQTTRKLADFVTGTNWSDLPAKTVHESKRRLIDSLACALGGYTSEPARIAREIAATASGEPAARILGSGAATSMEMAAFANTVMIRFLDCNDTYIAKGSGHPSDMIGACLAVADALHSDGKATLTSIAIAYEIFAAMADVAVLRERGWDQGVFAVLGATGAAAKLMGLSRDQTADALAIATTANVPTRQTRAGELSMWKGCATAASVKAAVFAASLAKAGMTGPTEAFEGHHGLMDQVTGKFELGSLGGAQFGIERANLKFFPSEYHSQAPLFLAIDLRSKVKVEDIEAVDVQTYYTAWSEIGSEPAKWDPQTRETADHSLAYLLTLGLVDGRITADSFSEERIRDQSLRPLMNRIRITENKEHTREFPGKLMTRIDITTKSGAKVSGTTSYPKGHAKNPLTDADLEAKVAGLAHGVIAPEQCKRLIEAVWKVDAASNIGDTLALCAVR